MCANHQRDQETHNITYSILIHTACHKNMHTINPITLITSDWYKGLLQLFLIPSPSHGRVSGTHVYVFIFTPLFLILLRRIPIAILVTLPVNQGGLAGRFLIVVGVV